VVVHADSSLEVEACCSVFARCLAFETFLLFSFMHSFTLLVLLPPLRSDVFACSPLSFRLCCITALMVGGQAGFWGI
jgi:hypothetical protein